MYNYQSSQEPQQPSSNLSERRMKRHHDVVPSDSPVDEEYPGDGVRQQPTLDEVREHYNQRLQEKVATDYGKQELEDDERVSSSVVGNPEELADEYDDVDGDDDDMIDGCNTDLRDDRIVRVSVPNDPVDSRHEAAVSRPFESAQGAPVGAGAEVVGRPETEGTAGPSPASLPPPPEKPISTVGLINEGCTCYLNSLLQLLFHLSYLRSAVYRIPADEKGDANVNTVYKALQELFFQMQERTTAARTKKLTDSFGWGEQELFVQHDIQEMATLLRDNLEERMKATVAEGAISQIFEGRGEQFVETLDKTYTSRSKDVFYDIHIPLSDHTNLLDSLKSLTQRDQLVGDNKYKVEEEGKKPVYKDAEKGYQYVKFPPVTWFHLKRFAMDLTSPMLEMKKVNTRMEFPLVLDLRDMEKGLSPEERASAEKEAAKYGPALSTFSADSPAVYDLQGVIVHRGTVRSGHYYCYIRDWDPISKVFTRWIEFDDDYVRVVPEDVAVKANYGGPTGRGSYYNREAPLSNANAYILSYVRRADAPTILAPSPTDIITQRVKDAMRREMEEEERRTKLEQAQKACLVLYVVTDESLSAYCEHNQSELFPRDARTAKNFAACVIEMRKSDSLLSVYEAVAAEPSLTRRGVTPTNCRLWRWTNTRGYRPTLPLATADECRRSPSFLADCLTPGEMGKPLSLCVYVQESVPFLRCLGSSRPLPPLPASVDLVPLVRRCSYDSARGTETIRLKAPTRVQGLILTLDAHYVHSCKVQYIVTDAANEELPVRVCRPSMADNVVHVPFDADVLTVEILLQCSSGADILPVQSVHVEVLAENLPPPLATASALLKPTVPLLPKMGHDRILLLLKWFDHVSCTVQYVGSVLVDRAATLASLELMWHLLMGLPVPPELVPPQHEQVLRSYGPDGSVSQSPPPSAPSGLPKPPSSRSLVAFFEEGKGVITRELPSSVDLCACGLLSGAVVVAQSLDFATAYRHARVETYYRTLQSTIDLRILEVAARVQDNEEECKGCLAEHKKLAVRLRENATAGHSAQSTAKSPSASAPSVPSSTVSPTSVAKVASNKPSLPTVEVDPTLDPFNTMLPVLNRPQLEVVGNSVCKMPSHWMTESACDAIALTVKTDPNFIRLYKNANATEPLPEERPVQDTEGTTVEDLVTLDSYTVSPVLFFERLSAPRQQVEQSYSLTVTLRDAAGHALHCEAYTLQPRETLQGLVRVVCASLRDWERKADPWGSMYATLNAHHFVLVGISKRLKLVRAIYEVPMSAGGGGSGASQSSETRLDGKLMNYNLELIPATPLQAEEQRIACCHGDYRLSDTVIHGHPFTITVNELTSVRDGLRLMQRVTHVPTDALNSQRETGNDYGVMMFTGVPLHFVNWDESIARFWKHTQNHSGHIPSLMLNHPRPKEKPGSRYVAQHNPQLKIAKN